MSNRRFAGFVVLIGAASTACSLSSGGSWRRPERWCSAFDGSEVAAFDHKVVTAYRWPVDEFSERLAQAGFTEVERLRRPGEGTHRPHAAIAAVG